MANHPLNVEYIEYKIKYDTPHLKCGVCKIYGEICKPHLESGLPVLRYLYKVVNCVNWVNLGLIGHA